MCDCLLLAGLLEDIEIPGSGTDNQDWRMVWEEAAPSVCAVVPGHAFRKHPKNLSITQGSLSVRNNREPHFTWGIPQESSLVLLITLLSPESIPFPSQLNAVFGKPGFKRPKESSWCLWVPQSLSLEISSQSCKMLYWAGLNASSPGVQIVLRTSPPHPDATADWELVSV